MYTYIHIYIHLHNEYTCIHTCAFVHIHTYIHIYMCLRVYNTIWRRRETSPRHPFHLFQTGAPCPRVNEHQWMFDAQHAVRPVLFLRFLARACARVHVILHVYIHSICYVWHIFLVRVRPWCALACVRACVCIRACARERWHSWTPALYVVRARALCGTTRMRAPVPPQPRPKASAAILCSAASPPRARLGPNRPAGNEEKHGSKTC